MFPVRLKTMQVSGSFTQLVDWRVHNARLILLQLTMRYYCGGVQDILHSARRKRRDLSPETNFCGTLESRTNPRMFYRNAKSVAFTEDNPCHIAAFDVIAVHTKLIYLLIH